MPRVEVFVLSRYVAKFIGDEVVDSGVSRKWETKSPVKLYKVVE
jgi:hypothetical protein